METTLLATKLFVPPVRPGTVPRPRLVEKLKAAFSHSLTLISAPAGFGKTTLVVQWIQNGQGPTAWLSLDESENDPVRFWEYVIASLRTLQPGLGEVSLTMLRVPQPVSVGQTLTPLINDLAGISGDFVMVLDDYHVIQSEAVHRGIAFLLEHLPPKMHLVVGTRADPPLPLARLRGKGALLEIGTNDLRFTSEEAADLLGGLGSAELSSADVGALNARAEGWVAGLKMAMLSMRGERDVRGLIARFAGSDRYIGDYLIEEVLQNQPPDAREFLLKTSILERMTGRLCEAITECSNGTERLAGLERANLFVVPLDASMEWYRYHHLFRDLLLHRLKAGGGDDIVAELRLRASRWYERNGFLEDAIHQALEAGDWERSMALISGPDLKMSRWQSLTMFNWFRRIPEEVLRTNVSLYFDYIWQLKFAGQFSAAEERLKYLEKAQERDSLVQGMIARVRGFIAYDSGDTVAAEQHATKALSFFAEHKAAAAANDVSQGSLSMLLAAIYMRQGRLLEAEPLTRETVVEFRQSGLQPILPLTMLALIQAVRGKLHEAIRLYREIIDGARDNPNTAAPHLYVGNAYYELNDLAAAASHYERAITLYQLSQGLLGFDVAYLSLARTKAVLGDADAAAKALENADRVLRLISGDKPGPENQARHAAFHAAIALFDGDAQSASRWADKAAEYGGSVVLGIPLAARHLINERRGSTAIDGGKAFYEQARQQRLRDTMIGIRIVQAFDAVQEDEALCFLAEALAMAKPESYIRSFADFGMSLAPLLRQAISRGIEPEYARKLLAIIEAEERQRKIRRGEIPASASASDILSDRELEVMRLIVEGLSNQQIAQRLTISLSTAKTHVYHIFDKLDARDRLQAVTKARELNLL